MESGHVLLEPPPLPAQPWGQRALTRVGGALDTGVLGAAQLAVDALLLPTPERLPELRRSAERLQEDSLVREPRRFFAFDPEPRAAEASSRFLRSIRGGSVVKRELAFSYRPYLGQSDGDGGAAPIRASVPFEHWMHGPRAPLGTVVALHGFGMGQARLGALALYAAQWFRAGLDVALVTLPHHGERTPPGARFSGQAFAVPDAVVLAETVRQAVFELRLVQGWLRGESSAPVGLLGLSLGGYLSALMAGLYDDLDFVIPMAPPVCIGDLAWRFFERSRRYRGGPEPAFSRAELRAAFRTHSPLAHRPRVARRRLLIIAGRGDRVVPPEHPGALWRHWGEPAIHWFSGGHLSPFGRRRIVARVRRHLEDLGIL